MKRDWHCLKNMFWYVGTKRRTKGLKSNHLEFDESTLGMLVEIWWTLKIVKAPKENFNQAEKHCLWE